MKSQRQLPKPIFGTRLNSFLGDKRDFCRQTIDRLRTMAGKDLPLPNRDDPVSSLKRVPKIELIGVLFKHNATLDDLIPVEIDKSDIDILIAEAGDELAVFSVDGVLPPREAIARMILQLTILDEICAPPKPWTAKKQELMKKLRAKYRKLLK